MARGRSKYKPRVSLPDAKFSSVKVAKLINRSMIDGKKSIAANHVYTALEIVQKKLNRDPLDILDEVINTVAPQIEVRSRRVGGASYQVPVPVSQHRQFSLSVRWLVSEARKRPNGSYHTYAEKLAAEMLDALKQEGGAIQKRNLAHRAAEANKAFSHFRW